ncbi:hypothetical protein ABN236_18795 [Proteus sp. fly-1013]|uniref:hypothetical protein n=1 Tax=Proteus sp. fly-1013 TaxID=3136673 RepID=UPI0032DB0F13
MNYIEGLKNNRYEFVRSPVSDEVREKLIILMQNENNRNMLAEDIIEMILIARNSPDGLQAVNGYIDKIINLSSRFALEKDQI